MKTSPLLVRGLPLVLCLAVLSAGCNGNPTREDLAGSEAVARATAALLPASFVQSQIVSNINRPTQMAIAPDGRIFVLEQGGAVRVVKNNALLGTPFATLGNVFSTQDYGLLGIAFDPGFASNRFVYVFYAVAGTPGHTRVSRLTANGDVATAGSETLIFQLDDRPAGNTTHQGGALHFGGDGKLYIFTGTPGDDRSRAQSLSSTYGKVLRINSDGSIPSDNPFFATATGRYRAIWALGLRNPFTAAVQPGTGRIYINDNGEDTWEEIDDLSRGANFGWPSIEGNAGTPPATGYRAPVHVYQHGGGAGQGNSVIGGVFYNPATAQFPATYVGKYFYADHVAGWIRYLDPANPGAGTTEFASGIGLPLDMDVAADGSLYFLTRGNGTSGNGLFRVQFTSNQPPAINQQPASVTASVGATATFCVSASGSSPLAYAWQRNGGNVAGATAACYTTGTLALADSGATFRVVVSNGSGSVTSNSATLTVTSNRPPVPQILTPAAGAHYNGGQMISYSGSASDPEEGGLPASAFTWWVDFHHNTHTHSTVPETSGITSGSFVPSVSDENATDVFYRIHLRVRDSAGLTAETAVDVLPNKVTLTLQTAPAGITLNLDGAPVTTPYVFESVVGTLWSLQAPSPATLGGTSYTFTSWSDGGAATHTLSAPAGNTTYTASYTAVTGGCQTVKLTPVSAAASSQETAARAPAAAIDGDLATRWSSVYSDPQWITVDLGASRKVRRVVLRWEAAASRDYDLGVSADNTAWSTVFTDSAGAGGVKDVTGLNAVGRYVRMFSRARTTQWGNSLWELEVYGDANPACDAGTGPAFQELDIGAVAFAGSRAVSSGVHTLRGSGADIWGTVDAFHFSYLPLAGDGDFRARVTGVQSSNIYAKAGIMIREGLGTTARNVMMAVANGQGTTFQRRTTTAGSTTSTVTAGIVAPHWVRLVRGGNVFTAYRSANGTSWTQVGQVTLTLAGNVYVGLAVTSHDNTLLGTGTFDSLAFP